MVYIKRSGMFRLFSKPYCSGGSHPGSCIGRIPFSSVYSFTSRPVGACLCDRAEFGLRDGEELSLLLLFLDYGSILRSTVPGSGTGDYKASFANFPRLRHFYLLVFQIATAILVMICLVSGYIAPGTDQARVIAALVVLQRSLDLLVGGLHLCARSPPRDRAFVANEIRGYRLGLYGEFRHRLCCRIRSLVEYRSARSWNLRCVACHRIRSWTYHLECLYPSSGSGGAYTGFNGRSGSSR